jgi:hypothetical protein
VAEPGGGVSPGQPVSPDLGPRPLLYLALLACVLAALMNPSLTANLSKVPGDSADRLFQSWQVAWNGHALLSQPLDFFDSNAFWPLDNSVAFSDALLGFTPAGVIGAGPKAAVVRYNLLFLFTYASAFFAAALLARELGAGWPAAAVAGAAFAFAPWRLAHHNHLHVLASAAIPLCLFLLFRGYRRARAGLVFAGFLAATWQVSLGFTLGLQLVYLLGLLGAGWAIFWWRKRPVLPRPLVKATVLGAALLIVWSGLQAVPYFKVLADHPEAGRGPETVAFYSPPLRSFAIASPENLLWGEATQAGRETLAWAPEMALFPGLAVLLLGVVGLAAPGLPVRWRVGLGLAVVGTAVLAMGYSFLGGRFTYRWLYELAPGWQSIRTPGRLFTLTSLALAILAGMGAQALAGMGAGHGARRAVVVALPAFLLVAVLAEGAGRPAGNLVTPVTRQLPQEGPQIDLPSSDFDDVLYMFWSIDGFPEIVNGYSGFTPTLQQSLRQELAAFPDLASVERLQGIGVRKVVLHTDRTAGTQWADAVDKPLAGLPVRRVEDGRMVIFELEPGNEQERAP